MLSILSGKLLSWLLTAGAAILAIGGIYLKGRRDSSLKHKAKELEAKAKTTEKVQNAKQVSDGDIATARKQLDRLSKRK